MSKKQKNPSERATYADLFNRLLDPTFILDKKTFDILEVNLAAEHFLGKSAEKLVSTNITKWVDQSDMTKFQKDLRTSRRRYYPRGFETIWHVDGSNVFIEATACSLALSDSLEVIQFIAKDITKQKEIEAKAEEYLAELKKTNELLEKLSITDELTQLFNVRHFQDQLEQEHRRAERYETPYSLVFFDLDNFKHYNDTNGHPAGDALLKGLADLLRKGRRSTDLPARYGGEEFVILCRGLDTDGALILGERVREQIEKTKFAHAESQPMGFISASIGIATYPDNGITAQEILKAADEALFESKHNGRNRVTVSSKKPGQASAA